MQKHKSSFEELSKYRRHSFIASNMKPRENEETIGKIQYHKKDGTIGYFEGDDPMSSNQYLKLLGLSKKLGYTPEELILSTSGTLLTKKEASDSIDYYLDQLATLEAKMPKVEKFKV